MIWVIITEQRKPRRVGKRMEEGWQRSGGWWEKCFFFFFHCVSFAPQWLLSTVSVMSSLFPIILQLRGSPKKGTCYPSRRRLAAQWCLRITGWVLSSYSCFSLPTICEQLRWQTLLMQLFGNLCICPYIVLLWVSSTYLCYLALSPKWSIFLNNFDLCCPAFLPMTNSTVTWLTLIHLSMCLLS